MPKIEEGYILLSRTLIDSRMWSYSDATLRVAIYLLLIANHKPKFFKGVEINRGQTCKSLSRIAEECHLSVKSVRYAIDILIKDGTITKDTPFGAQQGQRLSVCNYGTYQDPQNYKGTRGAHEGTHEGASNNKEKKENIYPFEQFWNDYDKKQDKVKCEKKYKTIKESELEKIRLHVPNYVASTTDVKFRKNPLTYLNGQCWQDEVCQTKVKSLRQQCLESI